MQLLAEGHFLEGFLKSWGMILASEIGDKTFFIAAIMAMKHPRLTVRLLHLYQDYHITCADCYVCLKSPVNEGDPLSLYLLPVRSLAGICWRNSSIECHDCAISSHGLGGAQFGAL